MKIIGLIGGMSWESTAIYYQEINRLVRQRSGGLASADMVIRSLNFEDIVAMQTAGDWDAAAEELTLAGLALESAGADCVLICTNTMHLVAHKVRERLTVPLINIIDVTADALVTKGFHRPLLLATRYTMEHGFYADQMARSGVTVQVPGQADRDHIHSIIFSELCQGRIEDYSRCKMAAIIGQFADSGADSVIFGCTEIGLLLDPKAQSLPCFDSTILHALRAVEFASPPALTTVN